MCGKRTAWVQMNEVVFSFDVHQIILILKVSAPFYVQRQDPLSGKIGLRQPPEMRNIRDSHEITEEVYHLQNNSPQHFQTPLLLHPFCYPLPDLFYQVSPNKVIRIHTVPSLSLHLSATLTMICCWTCGSHARSCQVLFLEFEVQVSIGVGITKAGIESVHSYF